MAEAERTSITSRRGVLIGAAALSVAAAPVAAGACLANGYDAELRRLWAAYLAQLAVHDKADVIVEQRRAAYDADHAADCSALQLAANNYWGSRAQKRLWEKHGLDPFYDARNLEGENLDSIVRAIREAKAESLFGVGVKLSAVVDVSGIGACELIEAIEAAQRALADLTGVDFIAATRTLRENDDRARPEYLE